MNTIKDRVLLLRKEEGSAKCLNDTLLARLRPYRSASVAATLVTLTGSESQIPRKEDGLFTFNYQHVYYSAGFK